MGLRKDYVRLSNQKESTREVCEHPGAVAVVAVHQGKIVLVQQYRRAPDEILLEIPAGLIKPGESQVAAARRELKEETGFLASSLKKLFSGYASPGYSTEVIHYYIARNLSESLPATEEDEIIEVKLLPLDLCINLIKKGAIKDNKTILGILAAGHAKLSG